MEINIVLEKCPLKRGSNMELTEEQKEKLKALRKKCLKKSAIATFLHVSWLFCANMATVMIDAIYVHNQSFVFFMTLGSTVIIFTGLHRVVEDIYKESLEEAKNIVGEEKK